MKKQRSIIAIAALLATAGASTTASAASPLLSGYGGPGQGNQAILGSTVLNVPRGGGGSGGPPAATGGGAPAVSSESGGSGASATTTRSSSPASSTHRAARPASRQTTTAAADPNALYAQLERRASESSGTLGLTGEDLLYVLIGLAVLAFGALFTRRIVRAGGAGVDTG